MYHCLLSDFVDISDDTYFGYCIDMFFVSSYRIYTERDIVCISVEYSGNRCVEHFACHESIRFKLGLLINSVFMESHYSFLAYLHDCLIF